MRKILASLDIGSDDIKLVVAEMAKNNKLNILASAKVPSLGIKNGFIKDPLKLMPKLEEAFTKCESIIGVKIRNVIATVPSEGAEFFFTEGSTTINNAERRIKNMDILRAMQASTYNRISSDKEIVSVKPVSYLIDDERTVDNPLGLEAVKLTIKSLVTTIPKKNINFLEKCLEKIGVNLLDYTLGSIGDYYEFQKEIMKENVGCIINIGYMKTEVSIFNKGILTNTETLNLGAYHIENDLAYIFKVSLATAKEIKNDLCAAHKRNVSASIKKEYLTKTNEKMEISEYEATEVSTARVEEILKFAKKQINLLTKKEIHYIMITGGVSEMPQFSMLVDEVFGHEAKILNIKEIGVRSNIYSSALGMTKYYDEKTRSRGVDFSIWNAEETEELSNVNKKINFGENSILGKLFGYFFDN